MEKQVSAEPCVGWCRRTAACVIDVEGGPTNWMTWILIDVEGGPTNWMTGIKLHKTTK